MQQPEPIWKTKGFESEYEYLTHLAKEKGYKSLQHEYTELWALQRGFESDAERRKIAMEGAGFESAIDYQDYLAKRRGFKSYIEYQKHQIKERGFESYTEYYEYLAKKKGFKSYTEYYEHLRLKNLAKLKGFESHEAYQEHLAQIEKSIRLKKEDILKNNACKFLQEKIVENVDPESLFAKGNIDFLRKITGCKIPSIPIIRTKDKK